MARECADSEGAYRGTLHLMVAPPLEAARSFAEELSEQFVVDVLLFDPLALPYSHPLHFSVEWLIADVLPQVPVPRGAVLRELAGQPAFKRFRDVPHFIECEKPPQQAGQPFLSVSAPPLGWFLL